MATSHFGLRQQAELFDFVAHHTRDAIFLAAPDGEVFFSNRAASGLFGYTGEEFLAGGLSLVCEGDGLLTGSRDAGVDIFPVGRWMHHKDGHLFRVEGSCASFRVEALERVVIVLRSVGNEQGTEGPAKIDETLAADAPVMIYVTDGAWRILWANDNKAVGSGYSIPELAGRQSPLRQYLGEEKPDTLAEIERELDRSEQWTGELSSRRKNGQVYPVWASVSVVDSLQPGERHRIIMLTDISALQETERMLRQVSRYDVTTGLPNRALFEEETTRALAHANPEKSPLYLLLLDIDSFGLVNEALGYETADLVLKQLAGRLRMAMGPGTFLSRHTSDTFAVLATGADGPADIAELVSRTRRALHEPLALDGHRFNLSVSVGVSSFPGDGETVDELLRAAGVALQRVRRSGGNGHAFYEAGAEALSRRFVELATPIREGLHNGEFTAFFQPIVDSRTWQPVSVEALARWRRQDGTFVSPAEFIPIAERSGAIRSIFETVWHHTRRTLRHLDGSGHPGLSVSINVSARQFVDTDFAEQIISGVRRHEVDPARILLEITESVLMDQPEEKVEILEALQREGIKIVIDDFGAGYSSFAYLKRFPVDGIKLDRLFVKDVPGDIKDEKLVAMMLAMGNELDIPMVAEGVETKAQADFLLKQGCSRLQGYLIAPPLSAEEFGVFLETARKGRPPSSRD